MPSDALSQIYTLITHPALALVVGLIISALQAAGVISMKLSRWLLFAAWLFLVFTAVSAMNNPPFRHQVAMALLVGIPSGLLLLGINWLIGRHEKTRKPPAPKPLGFLSRINPAPYGDGAVINGIEWCDRFVDCRLSVFNPNHLAVTDIDLTLKPDTPVVAITSPSGIDSELSPVGNREQVLSVFAADGTPKHSISLQLIGSTRGFRLHIPRLGPRQSYEITMAVANPLPAENGLPDKWDYVLPIDFSETGRDWYGFAFDGDKKRIVNVYLERPGHPTSIRVTGKFSSFGEAYDVAETVEVFDPIKKVIPQIFREASEAQTNEAGS